MQIDVRTNIDEAKRDLGRLRSEIQQRAIARALNRTAEQGNTQMVRAIAAEFNVKQSDVRSQITIRRAREGAAGTLLTVEIKALQGKRGRGYNVIRFLERSVTLAEAKRRQRAGTQNQLRFQIKRSGGRQIIRGAFVGNKGRTVFQRVGKQRLPIKAVTTIDVPQMFNTRRINEKVVAFMRAKFGEVLAREIAFYAARGGR